jgi:hypothetical protein
MIDSHLYEMFFFVEKAIIIEPKRIRNLSMVVLRLHSKQPYTNENILMVEPRRAQQY